VASPASNYVLIPILIAYPPLLAQPTQPSRRLEMQTIALPCLEYRDYTRLIFSGDPTASCRIHLLNAPKSNPLYRTNVDSRHGTTTVERYPEPIGYSQPLPVHVGTIRRPVRRRRLLGKDVKASEDWIELGQSKRVLPMSEVLVGEGDRKRVTIKIDTQEYVWFRVPGEGAYEVSAGVARLQGL
jgi:hypothetical protein